MIDFSQASRFCEELHRTHKRIVFTNGCFDLLHVGHVRYLQDARALGDFLFIGLNSDTSVRGLKGSERPVQAQEDRAEILLALRCVDAVCIFDEDSPLRLIEQVKPDVLVKGGDWAIDKIVGREFVEKNGGRVMTIPFTPGRSTTNLITKILKAY